jgi:ABC-type Fe3+ transport system permease subunit
LTFPLGRLRWPAFVPAAAAAGLLIGVPAGSLVWRAGLHGAPPAWSAAEVVRQVLLALRSERGVPAGSLLVAGLAGAACAALGLVTCWAALDAPRFRLGVLALLAVAWAMPGPVVGLGLKAAIKLVLDKTGSPLLANLLWDRPSLAPVFWADVVRFFPCAAAVLWVAVRLLPTELRDAARVDGAAPGRELLRVVWPLTAAVWLRAALAVGVLSLGELSAGKPVATAGAETWAQLVFTQMHWGVTPGLAARCLVLLAAVGLGGALVGAATGRRES